MSTRCVLLEFVVLEVVKCFNHETGTRTDFCKIREDFIGRQVAYVPRFRLISQLRLHDLNDIFQSRRIVLSQL